MAIQHSFFVGNSAAPTRVRHLDTYFRLKMGDLDEQEDELLAVSEILPPGTFRVERGQSGFPHRGSIEVSVDLSGPVEIVESDISTFSVQYLPPIILEFILPLDYPSLQNPVFNVSCVWLADVELNAIKNQLHIIGQDNLGSVVLFLWINFLQQDLLEAVNFQYSINLHQLRTGKQKKDCAKPKLARQSSFQPFLSRSLDLKTSESSCPEHSASIDNNDLTYDSKSDSPAVKLPYVSSLSLSAQPFRPKADSVVPSSSMASPSSSASAISRNSTSNPASAPTYKSSLSVGSASSTTNPAASLASISSQSSLVSAGFASSTSNPGLEKKDRMTGIVKSWNLTDCAGTIFCKATGRIYASLTDICSPDLTRLEVSLEVGQTVEFDLLTGSSHVIDRHTFNKQAVNITAVGGRPVKGSYDSEKVTILKHDVLGTIYTWNHRKGEGKLKLVKEGESWERVEAKGKANGKGGGKEKELKDLVYVYYTSLHFTPQTLKPDDCRLFRFNIVECTRYGIIAQYVRLEEKRSFALGAADLNKTKDSNKINPEKSKSDKKDVSESSSQENLSLDVQVKDGTKSLINENTNLIEEKENADEKKERKGEQKKTGVQILAARLREYNNSKDVEIFAASVYSCLVCFMEKSGVNCVRFPSCQHVYCRECMAQYFKIQIESGQVKNLTCPTDQCKSQALPNQVMELVPIDLFKKYESILLETTLESMVDVITCPRVFCQCPTVIDRENNMGQCPACQLSFCIYCRATYHGVSPCKMKTKEHRAILDKYNQGTDDEKMWLEKKYGRVKLQQLLSNVLSEDYLTQNARNCPNCNAPIEKKDGCNKMTCWRCNTYFCWLCSVKLNPANPYSHFNIMGGNCYGALFQGVDVEDDDDDWEEFMNI